MADENIPRPLGHYRFLVWLAAIAGVAAVVFAIWSAAVDTYEFGELDSDAVAMKAGVGAWADICLNIAITSTVGAIVLSGVRWMLHTAQVWKP